MAKKRFDLDNIEGMKKATGTSEALLETLKPETRELVLDRKNDRHRGRPIKETAIGREGSDYIRATSVVNKKQWRKIQLLARKEGVSVKTLLEAIFSLTLTTYEEKNGTLTENTTDLIDRLK